MYLLNEINFATTNKEKFLIAQTVCEQAGLKVKCIKLEVDEIQAEDAELIVRDKCNQAYRLFKKPIVGSDDSWDIPALNGFPGPYMKSLNYWFKPEDFLRLMNGIKDRTIILHQYLAFKDKQNIKVFKNDIKGHIIKESRGYNKNSANMSVIVLDSDNGQTIAQVFEKGQAAVVDRYKNRPDVWHQFIDWYTTK